MMQKIINRLKLIGIYAVFESDSRKIWLKEISRKILCAYLEIDWDTSTLLFLTKVKSVELKLFTKISPEYFPKWFMQKLWEADFCDLWCRPVFPWLCWYVGIIHPSCHSHQSTAYLLPATLSNLKWTFSNISQNSIFLHRVMVAACACLTIILKHLLNTVPNVLLKLWQ